MKANRNGIKVLSDRSCTPRKELYTVEEAVQAAVERSAAEGWKFNHYFCPKHKAYHIGHAFPRERIPQQGRLSCQS